MSKKIQYGHKFERGQINESKYRKYTKQRRYQLRRIHDGKCKICGKPAVNSCYCANHASDNRERVRKLKGYKKRYMESESYKNKLERSPTKGDVNPFW